MEHKRIRGRKTGEPWIIIKGANGVTDYVRAKEEHAVDLWEHR